MECSAGGWVWAPFVVSRACCVTLMARDGKRWREGGERHQRGSLPVVLFSIWAWQMFLSSSISFIMSHIWYCIESTCKESRVTCGFCTWAHAHTSFVHQWGTYPACAPSTRLRANTSLVSTALRWALINLLHPNTCWCPQNQSLGFDSNVILLGFAHQWTPSLEYTIYHWGTYSSPAPRLQDLLLSLIWMGLLPVRINQTGNIRLFLAANNEPRTPAKEFPPTNTLTSRLWFIPLLGPPMHLWIMAEGDVVSDGSTVPTRWRSRRRELAALWRRVSLLAPHIFSPGNTATARCRCKTGALTSNWIPAWVIACALLYRRQMWTQGRWRTERQTERASSIMMCYDSPGSTPSP